MKKRIREEVILRLRALSDKLEEKNECWLPSGIADYLGKISPFTGDQLLNCESSQIECYAIQGLDMNAYLSYERVVALDDMRSTEIISTLF